MSADTAYWRKCSSCKLPIGFRQLYWVCNVSTCNRKRTGLVFCKVACWDAHNPMMNHRDSWAEERRSPSEAEWKMELEKASAASPATGSASAPRSQSAEPRTPSPVAPPAPKAPTTVLRRSGEVVTQVTFPGSASTAPQATSAPSPAPGSAGSLPREVLIVASKLKAHILQRSGMSTSDRVMQVLSDRVRTLCNDAIRRAGQEGRKTVLDRDFK